MNESLKNKLENFKNNSGAKLLKNGESTFKSTSIADVLDELFEILRVKSTKKGCRYYPSWDTSEYSQSKGICVIKFSFLPEDKCSKHFSIIDGYRLDEYKYVHGRIVSDFNQVFGSH